MEVGRRDGGSRRTLSQINVTPFVDVMLVLLVWLLLVAVAGAESELAQYKTFVEAVKVPVLANITEFGSTPLFTTEELASVDVSIALYPLSAFRAANAAALKVYQTLRREGTQQDVMDIMQSRMDLYDYLGYHDFEQKLDQLFAAEESD